MLIHKKAVAAYDEDGRLIGKWNSTLEAAMENDGKPGCSKQIIKNCA